MSRYFPTDAECGHHVVYGSTAVRTYAGDHLQVSVADVPANGVVDWHTHPNEQMGVVVSGEVTIHVGDESKRLVPGEIFFAPGGVRHKVVAHDQPVRVIDMFFPIRDEYR